jgi:hypothetical protein
MTTVKSFWQHVNGKVYAIESDTFGEIIGAVGPLDVNDLRDPDTYDCKRNILDWIEQAFAANKLRRYHP